MQCNFISFPPTIVNCIISNAKIVIKVVLCFFYLDDVQFLKSMPFVSYFESLSSSQKLTKKKIENATKLNC